MQQSPCFNLFSPDETSKFFPSLQRFNNCLNSPRTLFFGLGLSSSGQHSYSKKNNILSKMKFSTSNTKQIINNSNKPMFLSNKRNYSSESPTKNINKKNLNNINKTNQIINTVFKNEELLLESLNDVKKTKASSKKNTTYIPPQCGNGPFNNYNYGYNNYYGYISNSSFLKFNKSAYIGSVKKNLLPSLSRELKSNSKNNYIENNKIINNNNNNSSNNNISFSINKKITNSNNKYNNSESKKNNYNNLKSNSKTNLNTSNKKTINDTTPYEYLYKTAESLDLEKMVDYIVSSTKVYNRYNDNKENYSNNHLNNNIININESFDNNGTNNNNINGNSYINSGNKNNKKNKKYNSNINSSNKGLNSQTDNMKVAYSICKCKKVECLKYSCSCLKSGNKCSNLCSCINCKNKDNNLFKIDC